MVLANPGTGLPVLRTAEGVETLAFEIASEQVVAIYAIRIPTS